MNHEQAAREYKAVATFRCQRCRTLERLVYCWQWAAVLSLAAHALGYLAWLLGR